MHTEEWAGTLLSGSQCILSGNWISLQAYSGDRARHLACEGDVNWSACLVVPRDV